MIVMMISPITLLRTLYPLTPKIERPDIRHMSRAGFWSQSNDKYQIMPITTSKTKSPTGYLADILSGFGACPARPLPPFLRKNHCRLRPCQECSAAF